MKILLAHNFYQQRGGEDVVFEQETDLLRRAGHQVMVYVRSNSEIRDHSLLRRLGTAKQTIWASDTRDQVADLIGREKPDVVHVHNTLAVISPSIYSACREADVPIVQTLHNYRLFCPEANFLRDGQICEQCLDKTLMPSVIHGCYRDSRPASAALALSLAFHRARQTWDLVDSYIALTNFARDKFIQGGLPASKLAVKPNFVHPDPGVRKNAGSFAVYVGRLSEEKGIDTLLQAWKRMAERIPLFVIGDGPQGPQLRSEYGQDSRITFCGRLPRKQVLDAVKGARFLMVPSRCYENFPLSIAEAYACGVPVLGSDIGAIRELVEHGRTGLLFPPSDLSQLAESVVWAWNHPLELNRMGAECRREFELKYTAEKNYESLLAIYEHVVESSFLTARDGTLQKAFAPVNQV